MELTAIVLAAGLSRRMGEKNKLFLPFNGKTLLEATIDNLLSAGIVEVLVVVGHEAKRVKDLLINREVQIVENPDYHKGMTSSIQAGVRAAPVGSAGFMICLSDMPLISPEEYRLLATAFLQQIQADEWAIVQPVYQGRRGNPVIFSSHYRDAILNLEFPEGCKPIVQENITHLTLVEMPGDAVLKDADDGAAYQSLLNGT